jgi:hypothetical protein
MKSNQRCYIMAQLTSALFDSGVALSGFSQLPSSRPAWRVTSLPCWLTCRQLLAIRVARGRDERRWRGGAR